MRDQRAKETNIVHLLVSIHTVALSVLELTLVAGVVGVGDKEAVNMTK